MGRHHMTLGEKPLIGFFPAFASMGETIPLVKIAKAYVDSGGRAIFFSHSREFEYLAEEKGFTIVRLKPLLGKNPEETNQLYKNGMPFEKVLARRFDRETIENAVEEEIEAFKTTKVEMIVSAFTITCSISARVLRIPLVVVTSGVSIPLYYESSDITIPEEYENFLIRLLPRSLKNRIAKWYLLHNKLLVREFNKVAAHYHVAPFRYTLDVLLGDHTLMCDDIKFLGIQPSKQFPLENFIGPLVPRTSDEKQPRKLDADIEKHLQRPGKSLVLAMGSAYNYGNLFPVLIVTLSKTDYNVIAVYKDIQNSDLRTKTSENILLKEFIPLDLVLKKVDLAITHGGRGTIYTVAYAGKPAICIPIISEQQFNIDNLVRAGAGVCLSKKNLDSNKILKAIDTIFDNYTMFLEHSQRLSKKLSGDAGEDKAVQRLLEIHQSYLRT
jgi:UDP:flavonoid glycosyltransferase YjiC (YdhE family)